MVLASSVFAQPKITAPAHIRWDRHSFIIENRPVILFGGSMHYFRIPEAEWDAQLRNISADGFNLIDTYVPWSIHEPEEGKFDFGPLQRFLDLAKRYGLYVVARPGPYICSEFDQGGFPRWLSGKGIGFRSNSELSRKWTEHWYDAVMPVLVRNQISRGGPVVMVQLENEYGHPQYLSLSEKKDYLRFLFNTASAHGFDIPLMGNDIQFAQEAGDPILSQMYGTVDAYFGSYRDLGSMLQTQRDLNPNTPVGTAEYSLAETEATLCTMLGLGTAYFDLYMFRGGSQFNHAAKSYENSSYVVSAPLEEGGYPIGKYFAMRTAAHFLRTFGTVLAGAEPASVEPTGNDPELWIKQRNSSGQGFLFVRSDSSGVNDRTLKLETVDRQEIRYQDPRSGKSRTIPQYSTLLLRPHESRIIPLDLPVRKDVVLAYSTAEIFGIYSYPARSWLVVYGDPGVEGEAAVSFDTKPAGLNREAVWNPESHEAVLRFQFAERDQVVTVSDQVSLLVLARNRAYRVRELTVQSEPALLVSDADEVEAKPATIRVRLRRSLGALTVIANRALAHAGMSGTELPVDAADGAQRLRPKNGSFDLSLPLVEVRAAKSWTVSAGASSEMRTLRSLPEPGIWRKGITRYRAGFQAPKTSLRLQFFTDDYHAVYANGAFVPEASNNAPEVFVASRYFTSKDNADLEILYVDTGRPKEDLGRWRMDEKKGLESSMPLNAEWRIDFSGIDEIPKRGEGEGKLTATEFLFARPKTGSLEAVWRAHLPDVRGLVYLNGTFLEHHQPGQPLSNSGDRDGIYLPPSMLKEDRNQLLFIALEPAERYRSEPPGITADPDSVRKIADMTLEFSSPTK